ncbi:hypothetical protein BDV95DRAFT_623874 [Massariosphaeria phaeospora]|uniref:Uncharacterized protein n=1 Tax=Massariosphaeria phaeospora TaxID=100035 RepID=A0A7C8M1L7_9PLEO|nr:hypothetical protein BDV95DRAFT_623874 [Massariosphaeria phaeospora]
MGLANNDFSLESDYVKNWIARGGGVANTDGSALRNGKADAVAGVGVYFGHKDYRSVPCITELTTAGAGLQAVIMRIMSQ